MPWLQGGRMVRGVIQGDSRPRDLIPRLRRSFHGGQDAARPAHHALRFCGHQPRCRRRQLGRCDKAGAAVAAVTAAPAFLNAPIRIGMVGSFGRKPIRAIAAKSVSGPWASQRPSQFANRQQSVLRRRSAPCTKPPISPACAGPGCRRSDRLVPRWQRSQLVFVVY